MQLWMRMHMVDIQRGLRLHALPAWQARCGEQTMTQRKPKDLAKFLHPSIAAMQLINLAIEHVLCRRFGTRVKWEIRVTYWQDENFRPGNRETSVSTGFKASSGVTSAIFEEQLTGRRPAVAGPPEPGTCKFCGCDDENACEDGCAWVDKEQTVCSSDECVAKYNAERGIKE